MPTCRRQETQQLSEQLQSLSIHSPARCLLSEQKRCQIAVLPPPKSLTHPNYSAIKHLRKTKIASAAGQPGIQDAGFGSQPFASAILTGPGSCAHSPALLTHIALRRALREKSTAVHLRRGWYEKRSTKHKSADWQFTSDNARQKLKRLYPQFQT